MIKNRWRLWLALILSAMPKVAFAQESADMVRHLSVGGGIYEFGAMLGAGLSVGLGCVAAGIALSNIGSSVVGAISEKPELIGKLLVILGLGEALAIYGLVMGILLWIKI